MFLYKSQKCKFKLSTDIEKNPGPRPMYVDPNKTIPGFHCHAIKKKWTT